jgi:predicted TIM-barrel fold metal-dependent hydrolase
VRETIDIFGAARAMFASDFPTDRLFASFDETLGTYAEAIHDLADADKRAVWGGNADRIYRLGLDL